MERPETSDVRQDGLLRHSDERHRDEAPGRPADVSRSELRRSEPSAPIRFPTRFLARMGDA